MALLTKSALVTAHADLDRLTQSETSLGTKRGPLAAELADAKAGRRELLITDAAGPAINKSERQCADLEGRLGAIDDALAEVRRRRVAAQARLEAAEKAAQQTRQADELNRAAATIDTAMGKVGEAAKVISGVFETLKAALPEGSAERFGPMLTGHENVQPEKIAATLVGVALGAKLPDMLAVTLAVYRLHPNECLGRPFGGGQSAPDLTNVMREAAAAIRGELASVTA